MVVLPIIGCALLVIINPAGPIHSVITFSVTSTAGFSCTVHVRVMVDPIDNGWMGLEVLLDITTKSGVDETAERRIHNNFRGLAVLIVCKPSIIHSEV